MKSFKKTFLGLLVFIMVAILWAVYGFIATKNKTTNFKIGNSVFEVELAETAAQQGKGLSFRDGLDRDKGMLFNFNKPGKYGFWMMGMRFPIDIIWISGGKIVGVEKNALAPKLGEPKTALKVYYPPEEIDSVLEINAGLCDELGIKIGDKIELTE